MKRNDKFIIEAGKDGSIMIMVAQAMAGVVAAYSATAVMVLAGLI